MKKEERKALGTGLEALFGGIMDEEDSVGSKTLPIDFIEPKKDQPRNYFDQEAIDALAESIKDYGILQPITVRELNKGYYQIIAGERRWRAAKQAGLAEVPVHIIEADDKTAAELALVENLQREDLNPIEEAKGFRTLIDEYSLTEEQTAKIVGKSRPAMSNSLRLLNLSPEVIKMVENGEISAGHGRTLLAIPDSKAQLNLAKEIVEKGLSVRATEKIVKKTLNPKELTPIKGVGIDYAEVVSSEISTKLKRKVKLVEGKKGGKIEISYFNSDDREKLIEAVKKLNLS